MHCDNKPMKIGTIKFSELSEKQVKFLPCIIDFNGEVTPQGYIPDGSEGSLLGRKLQGQEIKLPDQIKGLISEGATDLRVTGSFSDLRYWNWDKPADESDQFPSLLNHLKIMKSLSES
jgi:hypothetical protein